MTGGIHECLIKKGVIKEWVVVDISASQDPVTIWHQDRLLGAMSIHTCIWRGSL